MITRLTLFIYWLIFIITSHPLLAQNTREKKLIEFGWDYPDVKYIKDHLSQMEKLPFDGVVFSIIPDIINAFDTSNIPDSYFQYETLSHLPWKKLTENFLLIRGCGLSGAHWLDDDSWTLIIANLTKISKALSIGKIKGIGFDAEYYFQDPDINPWIYKPYLYNNLTYQQAGEYVRKRGKQFVQALQIDKPNVCILFFWLLGLVNEQNKDKPLEETNMALLPFFIEGVIEGKNMASQILDGNEQGYWYQRPEDFILAGENNRSIANRFLPSELLFKYKAAVTLAQPVYLDGIYAKMPEFDKGFDTLTKQNWLRQNLYHAFKSTDKYVWFYNEKIDWWRNKYDTTVLKIIKQIKSVKFQSSAASSAGKSRRFSFQSHYIDLQNDFSFKYLKESNTLEIKLNSSKIKKISLFENSSLIFNIDNPNMKLTINLHNKYTRKGNLTILSKDINGKFSVSYIN